MSVLTYSDVIEEYGIQVPGHLDETASVPIETRLTRQGDVCARREDHDLSGREWVPCEHINVVKGDAVRNSHILHCPGGRWYPGVFRDEVRDYGVVLVPEEELAYLTHTGEHGALALGCGTWRMFGEAEMTNEAIRRVAD